MRKWLLKNLQKPVLNFSHLPQFVPPLLLTGPTQWILWSVIHSNDKYAATEVG